MRCNKCGNELRVGTEQVGVDGQNLPIVHRFGYCDNCRMKWDLDVGNDCMSPNGSPNKKHNFDFGTASIILGISGFILTFFVIGIIPSVIGLVLGIVAISTKKPNRGRAIVGTVLSALSVAFFITILVATMVSPSDTQEENKLNVSQTETNNKKEAKKSEKEIEAIFYGEIGLNKDSYMGKEVAFSFKCGYATDYDNAEEITTDTNLCYGSLDVQFKESQKITEGEYITVSGIIGEDHSSTALTNAVILKRGEEAENNYNKELENFRQSFYDSEFVSYDDLLKYPDTYYNQKVKIELDITKVESDGTIFHGDITGVIPGTENKVVLYDYRDNREPRIQEGDNLTVYGVGNETVTVKVKDGSGLFADTVDEYDIPCLYVQYIEYR